MLRSILKRMLTKKFWEEGNAEIVGFLLVTPVLAFFLVTVAGFVQLSMVKTKMDYATYAACRAAAISATKSDGKKNAKKTFIQNMQNAVNAIDIGNVEIQVKAIAHNSAKVTKKKQKKYHDKTKKITAVDTKLKISGKEGKWVQGEYISCVVKCKTKTVSNIVNLIKPELVSGSVMLIESKSAEDADILKRN